MDVLTPFQAFSHENIKNGFHVNVNVQIGQGLANKPINVENHLYGNGDCCNYLITLYE